MLAILYSSGFVIPAKAGIHLERELIPLGEMDPGFRRDDEILEVVLKNRKFYLLCMSQNIWHSHVDYNVMPSRKFTNY